MNVREKLTPKKLQEFFNKCEETKKSLPPGPWMHEEHRLEFKHKGLDCMLIRHPEMFHWCGYVGVPKTHPLFEKHYDHPDVNVHGGLTFADKCGGHICHITEDPTDEIWWFGFDCAHAGDTSPFMMKFRGEHPHLMKAHQEVQDLLGRDRETYKTVDYVTEETMRLADQLARVA